MHGEMKILTTDQHSEVSDHLQPIVNYLAKGFKFHNFFYVTFSLSSNCWLLRFENSGWLLMVSELIH